MGPKVKFQRQFKPFDLCMMVWEISSYLNKKSKTRLILCLKSIKLSKMSLHEFESHIYIQLGPVIKEGITIWLKSIQRRLTGRMWVRDPSKDFQIFHGSCMKCSVSSWCVVHRNKGDRCNFIYKTGQTSKRFCQTVWHYKRINRGLFFQSNQSAQGKCLSHSECG